MSDVTICRACGLPRFHGPAGYAGAQCLCQWRGVTGASTPPATAHGVNQQLLEALEGMLLHIREPESESEFQWSGHFKKQKAAFVAARAAIAAARKGEV